MHSLTLVLFLCAFANADIINIKSEHHLKPYMVPILYGICNDMQLCTIDVGNGSITTFGPSYSDIGLAQELSSIDDIRKLIYTVMYNFTSTETFLIGIQLGDGTINTITKIPFQQGGFVGVGQTCDVEPITGDVFLTGQPNMSDPTHHILRVNPFKGIIKKIGEFSSLTLLGAFACYDPIQRVLWRIALPVEYAFLYAFDVATGNLLFNVSDSFELTSLDYDYPNRQMIGIGEASNGTTVVCTVVSLNTKGQFDTIGFLNDWQIPDLGLVALNTKERELYTYIMPDINDPLYFLVVDMDTAKVKHSAVSNYQPWSIEFRPAVMK